MCSVHVDTRKQTVSISPRTEQSIIVAIPSYDDRIFPRFDQAHEFYFAEINLKTHIIEAISAQPCPAQEQDVCYWLSKMGVKGIICSGIHHHHQVKFQQAGIWVVWGMSGNIKSTLQQWLKDQPAMVAKSQYTRLDHTDLPFCNEPTSI